MLEELLEHAAQVQAAGFGAGTLIGECLDTHHPHLPRRVFVQLQGADGQAPAAWLPTLADLRLRAGQQVLVSKPLNWPEPVVVGVLAGRVHEPASAGPTLPAESGPELRLGAGESLTVKGPDGRPLLQIAATVNGPELRLMQANTAVEVAGCLRFGADRIELNARDGGVDIRTDGDMIVRSHVIRLN
ncbi:hypothetical protein [Nannocystis pusilla]|uniref:Gp5/Type VI secretion system Vgr protein OB-fold domain-containing protein n=1 Tax=Nannocystis pusilla TaxID=889268 RepID=A0ABS7TMI7_9BACT|nr:hypothetical protein [Nannocystis pusilla]MBZ5709406.1 hypothetical protein [Nannocystis pusilla]